MTGPDSDSDHSNDNDHLSDQPRRPPTRSTGPPPKLERLPRVPLEYAASKWV